VLDHSGEGLGAGLEVTVALECDDWGDAGETGGEVGYGGRSEGAACTVREDQVGFGVAVAEALDFFGGLGDCEGCWGLGLRR
jgi:hypothetical protein